MLCIGIYTLLKLVCICVGEAASCSLKCLFPLGTWLPTRTDLWSYLGLGKVMFSSAECEQKYWLPLLGPGLPCEIYLLHTHLPFFLDFFFFMWTILKVFIEFVTTLLWVCLCVFFDLEACGILAAWLGIEPPPPALECEVLTTGPPGKSPHNALLLEFGRGDSALPSW